MDNETKEANSWGEAIQNFPCEADCSQKTITKKDIKEGNYLVFFGSVWGIKEIEKVYHKRCFEKGAYSDSPEVQVCHYCKKPFINLAEKDTADSPLYHPECLSKGKILYKLHQHPQLLKLKVNQKKIIAYLKDGREIGFTIDWLVNEVWHYYKVKENIKIEQLKNYEINGVWIEFPDIGRELSIFALATNYFGYCGCCSATTYDFPEYLPKENFQEVYQPKELSTPQRSKEPIQIYSNRNNNHYKRKHLAK